MKLKTDRFMWLKSIKENKNNCLYWGYLMIIGIIFYIMNCYTPLFSDDWHYCFIFGTTIPIESLGDILKSQYFHYFNMNGRFTPHFFVQMFDGILGKNTFNLFNTISFIILIILIVKTVGTRKENQCFTISIALFLIFTIMPGFNACFLWMSGACNYLWSGTLLLLFNSLLLKYKINRKYNFILFIYGILCGWTHEGIVIGLICGYTIYYLKNPKELISHRKFLLAGFFIGTLFLVFSPGSINRMSRTVSEDISFLNHLQQYFMAIIGLKNIRLFPIFCIILFIINRYTKFNLDLFINKNIVWLCAIIFLFPFIIATKFQQESSRFGIELFSLILILKLITNYSINYKRHITLFLFTITIGISFYAINLCYYNYIDYKCQLEQIKENKKLILTNSQIFPNIYWHRFLVKNRASEHEGDVYFIKNSFFHQYFALKDVKFCPKRIYEKLQNEPESFNSYQCLSNLPFYIKNIDDKEKVSQVKFILHKTDFDSIPFYIRPFASKLSRYTISSIETPYYEVIECNNRKYIIIAKNKAIDFRLKHIIIN